MKIQGYNVIRSDRNRHDGGVMCYIKDTICYKRLENFSSEFENMFVDILLPNTRPILLGNIYRPPDQSGFLESFSKQCLIHQTLIIKKSIF